MGFAQRVYEGTYLDRCCDHDYFKLRLEKERVFDLIVRSEDRLDSFHGKWLNHGDSIFCITDHSTWVKTEIRQLSLSRGNDIKIFATDTLGRIIPIELGPYIDNSKFTDTLQVNLKSLENNLEIFTRKYGKAQISFDGIKPGVLNIKMREILMVFKGNQVDSNTVFLDLGYISKLKRQ
jgi:hypothetical protein